MFHIVAIDGNFVQVQATRLARVTLLLAYVLYSVQLALVHQFLAEFVMWDITQVLVIGLADIYLLLLFLVVTDYKMGYAFVKAGVNKHFHNLVEIVVDAVVTTVHQTQHSLGVCGLDVLVLRVFGLQRADSLVVIVVYVFQSSPVNDELTRATVRKDRAGSQVGNAEVDGHISVSLRLSWKLLLLVDVLYLELFSVVLRYNPYLLEHLYAVKVFRDCKLDVTFAVVVLLTELLCHPDVDCTIFLYAATASLNRADHITFLVLVAWKVYLFGVASALFQNNKSEKRLHITVNKTHNLLCAV